MDKNLQTVPFRIGTTSYIVPDDILPNIHYLAGRVRDVELVLFELDDGPGNVPDEKLVVDLNQLAGQHDLTFTVHLPLDLRMGDDGDQQHVSLIKARRVIEATRALNPWAYVLHLDGKEHRQQPSGGAYLRWVNQSAQALELVANWSDGFERLAVENLDHYPLDFIEPVLERVPVSRCVDIGHLWLDGHDPLPYLEHALPRTRVIHIHGIAERDHKSLAHVPSAQLDPVLALLVKRNYHGVLTLEIFGEDDLATSLEALTKSLMKTEA